MKNISFEINEDYKCYGCRNCENICPKKAIEMIENNEGFLYPKINKEKCVNCGLCTNVCPALNTINRETFFNEPKSYAGFIKNENMLKKSTSGGIFYELANYVLENHGVVYGAAFDENLILKHIEVENEEKLFKIMGSKYLYSDLGKILDNVKHNLDEGIIVLFSGVPCQISALKNYLGKEYENLYTVEIICHGTPNQKLFSKYISYLEKKKKIKIVQYKFRSKNKASWGQFKAEGIYIKNGKEKSFFVNADFDKYYKNFLQATCYRESCYKCKFANPKRMADITLGDFWGVEKLKMNFLNNNGMSAIIINSEKGSILFENIKNMLEYVEVQYSFICDNNGQLIHPSKKSNVRESFYKNINKDEFIEEIKIKKNVKDYLKLFIPSKIKMHLKKFLYKICNNIKG